MARQETGSGPQRALWAELRRGRGWPWAARPPVGKLGCYSDTTSGPTLPSEGEKEAASEERAWPDPEEHAEGG